MNHPIFNQLSLFSIELLRMIDEGQTASIIEVCDNIEQGTITEFINTHCGFKNLNVTLESIGYDTVVIFGNPDNYVSRGFKSSSKYNVCLEGDIFPAALLVKELRKGVLDGRKWYYHESPVSELLNDEEKFKLFDAEFPPKVKEWKPSQEEFYIHSHSVIRQ